MGDIILSAEIILQLLENGKCHYLKNITEKIRINHFEVKTITNFLIRFNFVKLDEAQQKIRLVSPTNRFLQKIRKLENEENS